MGLIKPFLPNASTKSQINSDAEAEVGVSETTATCSPNSTSTSPRVLGTAAAVSSMEGTDCSRVSVPLGLWVWRIGGVVPVVVVVVRVGGRGRMVTLMSRLKMADKEE